MTATKWMRRTARVVGIINGLVWLSQVPGILVYSDIPLPLPIQVGLLIIPMLGVLIAWRWEGIGGWLLIINTIAFAVLPTLAYAGAGRNVKLTLTGALLLLPGLIAGILFVMCRRKKMVT